MSTPDEAFYRVSKSEGGIKKIAYCLINPIRMQLLAYGKKLTKEQEYEIEAEVQAASLKDNFSYREIIKLQDRLIDRFRGGAFRVD